MPDRLPSPEFETLLRQALNVPEPAPTLMNAARAQFIQRGIAALQPKKTSQSRWSPNWRYAVILLILLLLLALFTPPVAKALRSLFGFIPGFGTVEQTASLEILTEPITLTRDGVTVTLEQVIAAPEKTVVIYRHVEPEVDPNTARPSEDTPVDRPALLLPDGTRIEVTLGRRLATDGPGILYALEFGPLPATIDNATLVLPVLAGLAPGCCPENWQIAFRLAPGDPSKVAYPVVEYKPPATHTAAAPLALPTGTLTAEAAAATAAPSATAPAALTYGASLHIDQSVELPDGYLLRGHVQWTDPTIEQSAMTLGTPTITDANGQPVEFDYAPRETFPQPGELQADWAYKILRKDLAVPLRLQFWLQFREQTQASFSFDPGPKPANEQTWTINQSLSANQHTVKLISARYLNPAADMHIFEFTLSADGNGVGAQIIDPNHPVMGGGGSLDTIPTANAPFVSSFFIEGALPEGPLTLTVAGIEVLIPGDWVISWTP